MVVMSSGTALSQRLSIGGAPLCWASMRRRCSTPATPEDDTRSAVDPCRKILPHFRFDVSLLLSAHSPGASIGMRPGPGT